MTIRRIPEDFVVEEVLSAGTVRAGEGAFAVYRLEKTSLTTPEAVGRLAKVLGVAAGSVGYAGLKDKHARTVQFASVPAKAIKVGAVKGGAAVGSGPGWRAERVGSMEVELAAEHIAANRFTIVVRDMGAGAGAEMAWRARQLELPAREGERDGPGAKGRRLLIVNYFGDQRFGSARHGEGFAAKHLIRGDFEGAVRLLIGTPARKDSGPRRAFTRLLASKWGAWKELAAELPGMPEKRAVEVLAGGGDFREAFMALPHFLQQLTIEAFQSSLWNGMARRLARQIAGTRANAVEAEDEFGAMTFPAARSVGAEWMGVRPPMLCAGTELREPWGEAAAGALEEEGVALAELKIAGLRRPEFGEAERPLFVVAEGFEEGAEEADELASRKGRMKKRVGFELPRGAYATVVLRGLGQ